MLFRSSLSLGEERALGTHAWHMTLPVSAIRQWLIKLGMAMFTSLICAWALPVAVVLVVGYARGTPFIHLQDVTSYVTSYLFALLLLTAVSFWCACAVKGTWPAVAWLFPAEGAVLFAIAFGNWVAQQLAQNTGTLRDVVVSSLHLDPAAFLGIPVSILATFCLIVPATLFAVIQSYRMFRTQPQDSVLGIVRSLLALALVLIVCSFSISASGLGGELLPMMAGVSGWHPRYETTQAIEKLQTGQANLDAAHPRQFTVDDLAKAAPLSPLTQRWLRDSRTTLVPDEVPAGKLANNHHAATIHLASGLECKIEFASLPGKLLFRTWSACEPAP